MAGFSSGVDHTSLVFQILIPVFFSLALYNVIELTFLIFHTFKRHSGLYFWSCVFATGGLVFQSAGFFILYYASPSVAYLAVTISLLGWIPMVTGQSLVLWSRLHLILHNRRRLRMILWMIIINAILCTGGITPMIYGSVANPELFHTPFQVMERIEVTVFFVQELIISGVYIFETIKLMRVQQSLGISQYGRSLMKHLIIVNIIIIILDGTIIALEYANQWEYQTAYKTFAYSAKLKLEFTILNRLVDMTKRTKEARAPPQEPSSTTRTISQTGSSIAQKSLIQAPGEAQPCDVSFQATATADKDAPLGGDRPSTPNQGVLCTTEVVVQREDRCTGPDTCTHVQALTPGGFSQ
ncbi:hypothetical protein CFAM422_008298 [Trichoderma lentiforme]|uniref:DUF7703 domain-containing protein n=1 Tax=Trichoderma lentiforme TaxID=1567552 RepID=A0A9P4XBP4_9HYPO|nr:hypothetical protein CFAM422_008298 [Trichoderma lentiforme]